MILITYGTRPEYLKIKPLMSEFKINKVNYKTLFTGQHKDISESEFDYSIDMVDLSENRLNSIIKNCLSIPIEYFDGVDYVIVQGDTSTALGISITAFHMGIKIIHLEAGLRTFDLKNPYPEEANRLLISKIANYHFCPTENNKLNLLNENIPNDKIFVVGNTSLDNLVEHKLKCNYDNKILITLHRRENQKDIEAWFKSINSISEKFLDYEFILPIHPNPNIQKYKGILKNVEVVDPLNHESLLNILTKCKLVITDSGGIQEECSYFNKKCIVCRKKTERIESLGTNSFLCESPDLLENIFNVHIKDYKINYDSPYGNGESSKMIVNIIKKIIDK
jgi:UDP-N-acetylglucosamine 2-epimerase (non-hydrolysing)